jgi:3',5'-cyclic AMP phosphodiesterase CpdA
MKDSASTVIAIVTDTHLWQRRQPVIMADGTLQLQPWSERLLDTLIADLAAAQVDLVVHLGDQTCGGGSYAMPPDEFAATLHHIHARLHTLSVPVVALPGNHDARPGDGDLSDFHALWQYEPGLGKMIDLPHARLILLNTMGHSPEQIAAAEDHDPVYGWVSAAELQRLDTALATADGRPVLLFAHQLLAPWQDGRPWHDYFGIANAPDILSVIERRGGVRAIFQGHAHRLNLQERRCAADQSCVFGVMPALIEYPVGWMQLTLTATQGHCLLQRLPLAQIANLSAQSGSGQSWRQGEPAWRDYRFPL